MSEWPEFSELSDTHGDLRDAYTAMRNEIVRLRAALKEAREMVEDWSSYASPYFQEKHDLEGDLRKIDAALRGEE